MRITRLLGHTDLMQLSHFILNVDFRKLSRPMKSIGPITKNRYLNFQNVRVDEGLFAPPQDLMN